MKRVPGWELTLTVLVIAIAVIRTPIVESQSTNARMGMCAGTHPKTLVYVPTTIGISTVSIPVCVILPPNMTVDMNAAGGPSLVMPLPLQGAPGPMGPQGPQGAPGQPWPITTGAGMAGDGTPTNPLRIDGDAVPTGLSATATVNFTPIPQTSCATGVVPLIGASEGDVVSLGPPAVLEQGVTSWGAYVSFADTVTVRVCGTVIPKPAVWRVMLMRSW